VTEPRPEAVPPAAATAAAAALHADRERIREGAAALALTLWRPGNGSGKAHGSSMDVVPLAELLALIGGEPDPWPDRGAAEAGP
jgi:hypothetical protein